MTNKRLALLSLGFATSTVVLLASGCMKAPTGNVSVEAASQTLSPDLTPPDDMVIAHHQVMVDGKPLRYTTRTGLIPIHDDRTGRLLARMFTVAYIVDQPADQPRRPLTFLWNGGPGANSMQVQLGGFGPKGLDTPATYPEWEGQPTRLVDRPDTLLTATNLVFVDPIGTGYSRPVDEDARNLLFNTNGDAEAVAEMIRVYRTRYDAFDQPLFIGGESYGTTRAMEVAYALARRRTPLSGVILISGGYDAGQEVPRTLMQALQVPHFTATAHYHKRLPADLQSLSREEAVEKATEWARNEYAPLLEKAESLSARQKSEVLAQLQYYTGVDAGFADPNTLVLHSEVVYDRLLDDQNMELGRYDSRMKTARRDLSGPWFPLLDPSILPMIDMMQGTSPMMIRYIRETLGYKTDLLYKGPFGEGFHPEPVNYAMGVVADDWMTLNWGRPVRNPTPVMEGLAPLTGEPALKRAMTLLPDLRVYNVKGMYDGSCAAQEEAIARTAPEFRSRVQGGCYAAGHMVYTDVAVRQKLQADLKEFIAATARR